MTRRYKAFISYSWADKKWGEWLHRTLETYRAPKGVADGQSLHPIFKDREEEAAGGSVGAAIEAALGASEFLIVICSPRSAKSTWVNREVAWFKTHKDKGRVLALIVDGEPGASASPGRVAEECFPKTLTHKVGADLQPTEEWEDAPLAADARAEGDGRRGAKLKLAAALLGVGLDALVRRDERRRTIRRRLVTGAAFGLAAALGGLSIFAFNQRDAAVVARNEALKARDDAEGLIELILTDLKSDLEGFGTLKSVTQIGNRAIGYYEGQDVKALTPDQLGRRARVLLMLGEADNKRGDLSAALARYQTAAATTSEQLARDPTNPQRMFDHAQSVFWVGYTAWQRGDREKAKHQFTEYHELAQKLVASDPANEDWQAELDYAYSNLGTLAMDDGEAAAAEGWFRKSLKISVAKLERAPNEIERIVAAGQSFAWLADAQHRQGRFQNARVSRLQEIKIYQSADTSAESAVIQQLRGSSLYRLSQIEISTGNVAKATALAGEASQVFQRLYEVDTDNADLGEQFSRSLSEYGECLIASGRYSEAEAALKIAIEVAQQFAEMDPNVIRWEGAIIAQAKLALARTHLAVGDFEEAKFLFDTVSQSLAPMASTPIVDPLIKRRFAEALAGQATLSNGGGDLWRRIVDLLGAEAHAAPETQMILIEAHSRLGDFEEAYPIVRRLQKIEFRHPAFIMLLEEFPILLEAAQRRVH